jgi:two-component system sensor histidine kinase BaeS
MTFGIQARILLTLFCSILVVVGAMGLAMHWNFNRGFMMYVASLEQGVEARLIDELRAEYRRQGDWDYLKQNRSRWRALVRDSMFEAAPARFGMILRTPTAPGAGFDPPDIELPLPPPQPPEPEAAVPFTIPLPPPGEPRFFGRHHAHGGPVLFDRDKRPVVGSDMDARYLTLKPIRVDNDVVGFVGMPDVQALSDDRELRFLRRHADTLLYTSLAMMVIAGLIAWPLSRRMVQPIRDLSAAARRLAEGDYSGRIEGAGRDEISQLAQDFNSLARTLEANEKSRRRWIADISHELRTPLSVLQGEIEAMQDGVRPCTPERLQGLHREVLNLGRLVNDLYELSLSDAGALSYQKQRMDVVDVLQDAVRMFEPRFAEKNIAITFLHSADQPLWVSADPNRLLQLFTNLLSNSQRYTDPGGRVEVQAARRGPWVSIDFRDSAPGVPPEALPRLFERLYRVEDSRNRATGGSGLGLAISQNIVAAHDGRIAAKPSSLGGLWINVELPAAD